jgi:hypothetical protein
MRLVGSDRNLKEVQVNEGKVVQRNKDGTFHMDGPSAKALVKSGDFAVAGITFRNAVGWVCQSCNFVGLYRDACGKCGSTNLEPETE